MKNRKWLERSLSAIFILIVIALLGGRIRSDFFPAVHGPAKLEFELREVSHQRGLDFKHQSLSMTTGLPIEPWIRAVSATVSVVDVNHDGFMDIYVGNGDLGAKNELFINDGKGHFTEQAEKYGLADLNQNRFTMRTLFFDCDNDGKRELLQITSDCPKIFRQNSDERFEEVPNQFGADACGNRSAVAFVDLNGDGYLDIILGGYPASNEYGLSVRLPANFVNSEKGSGLTVLMNDGQCHFHRADGVFPTAGRYFYTSAGVGDLRGFGRADVWLTADSGPNSVFLESGEKKYSRQFLPSASGTEGMNTELMYLNPDEPPYVFVSQIFKRGYVVGGNELWHYENGGFHDRAIEKGLHDCGWAFAGRAIDLGNTGHLDLAVVNGYISGDTRRDFWYPFSTLMNGPSAFIENLTGWPDMRGLDFSGHQRDCLFVNRGDHFENVSEQTGFDNDFLDGRSVAVIDPDNSGVQDLVVLNQNGPLKFYDVKPSSRNSWIGFSLQGAQGKGEGLGAKITLTSGAQHFVRENYNSNSFASQSDPRVHFGLGTIKKVELAEIRWPDGKVQRLKNPPLNQYIVVREPES